MVCRIEYRKLGDKSDTRNVSRTDQINVQKGGLFSTAVRENMAGMSRFYIRQDFGSTYQTNHEVTIFYGIRIGLYVIV